MGSGAVQPLWSFAMGPLGDMCLSPLLRQNARRWEHKLWDPMAVFKFQLHWAHTCSPWANGLTCLSLSFPTGKMRMMIFTTPLLVVKKPCRVMSTVVALAIIPPPPHDLWLFSECLFFLPVNIAGSGLHKTRWIPHSRMSIVFDKSTLTTWYKELTLWKRPWCWERLRIGGEWGNGGWDGWMTSPTQWTWVWTTSGRQWRTGVLQSMGLQRVRVTT